MSLPLTYEIGSFTLSAYWGRYNDEMNEDRHLQGHETYQTDVHDDHNIQQYQGNYTDFQPLVHQPGVYPVAPLQDGTLLYDTYHNDDRHYNEAYDVQNDMQNQSISCGIQPAVDNTGLHSIPSLPTPAPIYGIWHNYDLLIFIKGDKYFSQLLFDEQVNMGVLHMSQCLMCQIKVHALDDSMSTRNVGEHFLQVIGERIGVQKLWVTNHGLDRPSIFNVESGLLQQSPISKLLYSIQWSITYVFSIGSTCNDIFIGDQNLPASISINQSMDILYFEPNHIRERSHFIFQHDQPHEASCRQKQFHASNFDCTKLNIMQSSNMMAQVVESSSGIKSIEGPSDNLHRMSLRNASQSVYLPEHLGEECGDPG